MKKDLVALLFLITVTLGACGNPRPSTTMKVTLSDFHFSPSQFTVPASAPIAVEAVHDGVVIHDFIIMNYGANAGQKFDEEDKSDVYWELTVRPGETRTASFVAPSEPGVYQVLCGTPGHLEAGMSGTLTVVAQEK